MESNTFDQIISRLGQDTSRRRVLGGALGAATAAIAGAASIEAKPNARSRKRRGHAGGAADKVAICHVTSGREDPERIRVGRRALKAHLAHGDTPFVDCCVHEDCEVPECYTAQCANGTCSQTTLPPGASCTIGAGAIGECNFSGECVPTATGGG